MEAIMRGMSILSCPKCCFLNLHNVRALVIFSDSFVRQFQPNTPKPHFPFQSDGICQNHLSPVLFAILATSACYTNGKHQWNLNSLPLACDLVHLNHASITSAIWGKNTDGACLVGPVGASKQIDTNTLQMDPHFECNWSQWASRLATKYCTLADSAPFRPPSLPFVYGLPLQSLQRILLSHWWQYITISCQRKSKTHISSWSRWSLMNN